MSGRPVVAHVLGSIGLGGVPEVAWQLLRRLPDDRFDQRVYALRRAEGEEETRAARVARIEARGVPVSFADASGSLGVVAHLCDWLVAGGVDLVHTHSYRPNLQGRLAAVPLRPRGRASSPTTTTATTTSGPGRGPSRSSASSRPRPIASSRARRRRPSTSRRASASPPSASR